MTTHARRRRRTPVLAACGALVVVASLVLLAAGPMRATVGPRLGWDPLVLTQAGRVAAVVVSTSLALALAARLHGRVAASGIVAFVIGVVGQVSGIGSLRAGAAVMCAVLAGVLAVMATRPARTALSSAREVLVAVVVAGVGALTTAAYAPRVAPTTFRYVALVIALVGVFVVVAGLGAGLHGLGRRGVLIVLAGALVLAATVAYGEAIGRWGTPEVVHLLAHGRDTTEQVLGARPSPVAFLLGFPALTWGVFMRARRRQGWWACGFGVAATTPIATVLVEQPPREAVLGMGWTVVFGVLLGYLLIRLDLLLTTGHGNRRAEQESALRPEPRRSEPLG